ncbi:hypothetical protein, partial [Vibrio parahaemolyticus]|uniref:hypothetical protein n=1 Tax=Vibrio parahaemolyticus TaxID=670 RepID=UPI001C60ADC7
ICACYSNNFPIVHTSSSKALFRAFLCLIYTKHSSVKVCSLFKRLLVFFNTKNAPLKGGEMQDG